MSASATAVAAHDLNTDESRWKRRAATALRGAAAFWLTVAVLGQLLFAFYVADFYGRTAVQGRWQAWNDVLSAGYIRGDSVGNSVLAAHLLCAVLVMLSGAAQLVPLVRRHWPRFHRWNGRFFLISAVIAALGGVYMITTRHIVGDDTLLGRTSMTLDALLIVAFAGLALHYARARRFDVHRRWALRLFLAVSGVWFFRVGLMFWLVVNHGPVGFDPKTFTGPFLTFLGFAQYLLPLAVLQLYFLAERSKRVFGKLAMAGGLVMLTLMMGVGIAAAFAMMWLPHL
ncbi:DUF2306 domain-containing protein [Dyella mobilis]|uniref:DUF2306 domain-containing protein n=1 Tax=Dyella mobilis TaxID=1849582 RepID=A0ABS2KG74_9GAMM|nr:DUF2306 domain-containing protein [Dyella mobilis]MBM7129934.1 DUF2306 domain-containing protein [Dyella mobilis]GLQ97803.1 membrane protein [Dyella mobilis]